MAVDYPARERKQHARKRQTHHTLEIRFQEPAERTSAEEAARVAANTFAAFHRVIGVHALT